MTYNKLESNTIRKLTDNYLSPNSYLPNKVEILKMFIPFMKKTINRYKMSDLNDGKQNECQLLKKLGHIKYNSDDKGHSKI